MAKHEISDSRKTLYYGGMVVTGIGVILFLSTFVRFLGFGSSFDANSMSMGSFMGPPFVGVILIAIGGAMRNVGLKGTAGSGIVLDPDRAREDFKPWTEMAGGMVKDVMDEVKDESHTSQASVVKIRCRNCKTLNEEDASFCKSCGQGI